MNRSQRPRRDENRRPHGWARVRVASATLGAWLLAPPIPPPGLEAGQPTQVAAPPETAYELEPRADGGYVYRDSQSTFRAVVRPDGSVEYLRPLPDLRFDIVGFDVFGRSRPQAQPRHELLPGAQPSRGTADPTHDPGSYGGAPILVTFGGQLPGPSDLVQRRAHFAAKQRFLRDTAALRAELRRGVRDRHARSQLLALEGQLRALWFDVRVPLAERKRRLFQRWDECAEPSATPPGATPEERERAREGGIARKRIEAFVRRHAERGSALGYSRAELDALNAKRASQHRFDPYDASARVGPAPPEAAEP